MQLKNFTIDQNLKELTPHRTATLPVACYGITVHQNINGYIPLHWHDELQFMLVTQGEAVVQIKEEVLLVGQGEGVFINSGCFHSIKEKQETPCSYICLNVAPTFLLPLELHLNFIRPYTQATNFPYLHLVPTEKWNQEILYEIERIGRLFDEKTLNYELDVSARLANLWKNIVINAQNLLHEPAEALKNKRMKLMLNWIHLHYTEKVSLDDIAKAGQLSRSECCRYFKRFFKTTPISYVTEYRIQQALPLLQQQEKSITTIAYEVGFNSTSYFIGKFHRSMNMTPVRYRKYTNPS